jgi:hypothetical protein
VTDSDDVAEMVAGRKLLRLQPSPTFVNGRLKQAADNVDSARLLCQSNPRAAVTIAYDAIRFAVDAHMQANGLRVANEPGAHRASVRYCRARMSHLIAAGDLDDYEVLRDVRNRIEYPEPGTRNALTPGDAEEITAAAERIVRAVATWWITMSRTRKP